MIETFLWVGGTALFLLSALLVGAWWAVCDVVRETGGNPHDWGAGYGCLPLTAQRQKTDESKFHVEQNHSKQPKETPLCQTP